MPRRTADETRTLILEAAIQLLLERGVTAGVQHVRLQEVLRTVGLTTGAAYRIWNDQDDFHRDLAVAMVGVRFAPPVTSAVRHRESIDAFAEFYGALLQHYRRRMREPLTIVDFTEAMAALGEGFAIRAAEGLNHPMYDIPDGAEVPSGEWTLFGISILGMIEGFTVPIDDADVETPRQ
jgi:AcrR family transcriptional regulator